MTISWKYLTKMHTFTIYTYCLFCFAALCIYSIILLHYVHNKKQFCCSVCKFKNRNNTHAHITITCSQYQIATWIYFQIFNIQGMQLCFNKINTSFILYWSLTEISVNITISKLSEVIFLMNDLIRGLSYNYAFVFE